MTSTPAPELLVADPEELGRPRRRSVVWHVLRTQPQATIGALVLLAFVVVAALAPVIAPYGEKEKVGAVFEPPSSEHWLGLDDAGVDMFTLMLYGARVSLVVGFAAALVAMLIGGTVGLLAGYFGGRSDTVLMRLTDYFIVIPDIPLMLVVAAIWGRSLTNIILIIGVIYWTTTARVVRAQVLSLRERVYVKRARAVGAGHGRVLFRHVLPQVAPLLVAMTVLSVAVAIFAETAIAFLGLGDPTLTSWGKLIENAFSRSAISVGAWWAVVPPGVAVVVVVLACTLVGRSLEDSLNPRLRVGHLTVKRFSLREAPEGERR
ncbi:MAG TPA: ABC transporter permease [Gaiellaceae bacterium]|nr:ABC transporter permease [Gaiellaceae bacterium]